MKVLFFWFVLLLSIKTTLLESQTSKGSFLLGGSFSGNFSSLEKIYMADASPTVGVFVENKLLIGGSMQVGIARYGSLGRYTSLKMLPMARYYLGKPQQQGRLFLQADVGYHRIHTYIEDLSFAKSGLGGGGGIGAAYFFNRKVSMEGLLKSSAFWYTNGSRSLQPELRLGIQLYLNEQAKKLNYGIGS